MFICYRFSAVQKIADKFPGLIEIPKEDGFTALHLAAFNNHIEIGRCLLLSVCRLFQGTLSRIAMREKYQLPVELVDFKTFKTSIFWLFWGNRIFVFAQSFCLIRRDRYHLSTPFLRFGTFSSFDLSNWRVRFCDSVPLTNTFHVAMRVYSVNAQMTSKCGKNKEVRYEPWASSVTNVLNAF